MTTVQPWMLIAIVLLPFIGTIAIILLNNRPNAREADFTYNRNPYIFILYHCPSLGICFTTCVDTVVRCTSRAKPSTYGRCPRSSLCEYCLLAMDHHHNIQHRVHARAERTFPDPVLCLFRNLYRFCYGSCLLLQSLRVVCVL